MEARPRCSDQVNKVELLNRLAEVAAGRGLMVAPVGSVYFLSRGRPALRTKDVVIHERSGRATVSLQELEALGKELGAVTVAHDGASVTVDLPGPDGEAVRLDLLRGKRGAKKGFFPRELLAEAADRAVVEGNILWYPKEYVIVLKADAAVDRAQRAAAGGLYVEENARRAANFRQDVVNQVQAALEADGLRGSYLRDAVGHLKRSRRAEVARLIEVAGGGRVDVGR